MKVMCSVFSSKVMEEIREGFDREGLQGLQGRIVKDMSDLQAAGTERVGTQEKFKRAASEMVLPAFVIRDGKDWRFVSYQGGNLLRVARAEADVTPLFGLEFRTAGQRDV